MKCLAKLLFRSSLLLVGMTIACISTNAMPKSILLAQNISPTSSSQFGSLTGKREKQSIIIAREDLTSIPQRWENKQYQPPSGIGRPRTDSIEPGGSRSGDADRLVSRNRLLVLTPSDGFGVTTLDYPTFLIYIPDRNTSDSSSTKYVEFSLAERDGQEIYQTQFPITSSNKIIGITLPKQAGLNPLSVGNDYQWSLSIYDRTDSVEASDRSEGWISRVKMKSELADRLQNASELDKVRLYIQAEIWYDALAILADLYRQNPHNAELEAEWQALLNAAGLNNIHPVSLFPN